MTTIEQSYGGLYPKLVVLALGNFAVATNGFVIAGLLPQIGESFAVHASDVSYSITFYALVVAVLAPVISITMSRVPRTALMVGGLVIVAIGTLLAAGAPNLEIFTIARVVAAIGGAAFVPTATAASALLASPERRGRAIGFVALGFTASTAFGAPLGTAVAAASNWRVPMVGIAVVAAVAAVGVALLVKGIPLVAAISVRRRFAVLAHWPVTAALVATLLLVCSFNVVYIFSSAVAAPATGGSGSALALLLLLFGASGIVGNLIGGRLVDRFGNRPVGVISMAAIALILVILPFVVSSFVATAVLFVLWGVAVNAATLPVQHRLVEINPATSPIALSWFSTALYGGIAIAPFVGAEALRLGNPELIPFFGAAIAGLGLAAFLLGWAGRKQRTPETAPTLA